MKKILLILLSCICSAAMAQITITTSPSAGCPNTTHNVTINVKNEGPVSLPNGTGYTVTLNVRRSNGTILKTITNTYTSGFAIGETKSFVITSVPFEDPMTCTVDGTITGPIPYTIPSQNYVVQYPPDLTITNTDEDLSVSTSLNGYSVRYYLDGNYNSVINESTTGNYTAINAGSYTAKAYDPASGCISQNPSNAIVISGSVTGIQNSKTIQFSVYPNPVTSFVTIQSETSSTFTYELSGINGKVVRSGAFHGSGQINMEELNTGTYVLIIKSGNESLASYKLVK